MHSNVPVTVTADPHCRHTPGFIFVTFQAVAGGLVTATCSNCGTVSGAKATRLDAHGDLLRKQGTPAVTELPT